VPGLSQV